MQVNLGLQRKKLLPLKTVLSLSHKISYPACRKSHLGNHISGDRLNSTKNGCDFLLLVVLCVVTLDGEISCNKYSSIALHHVTLFWIFNGKSGFSVK